MDKQMKLFYSPLTSRIYASKAYRLDKNGLVIITGRKYDVTDDFNEIAKLVIKSLVNDGK